MPQKIDRTVAQALHRGVVIPASPLALTAQRRLDERRQRALWRYYFAAGAGGLAVGVHTTQFAIRRAEFGLLKPVLALAAEEMERADFLRDSHDPLVHVAGVCGRTDQAVAEAALARDLGYHLGLLSLAAMDRSDNNAMIAHCRAVADVIPVMGFYLQPAAGGRVLPLAFWRRFVEIENVAAVKIAPFNRYRTIDVIRAVAEAGRDDVALYTGNDDNIVTDLITPYRFQVAGKTIERRIVGGLLGHWAIWTHRAVELLEQCHATVRAGGQVPLTDLLARGAQITDANAAVFDAAHNFAGCIPGIHEVLRRQGLLAGTWCLEDDQTLSPGQVDQIDRICRAYPHLNDDDFVTAHLDQWLAGTQPG